MNTAIAKAYAFHRRHGGGIVGQSALWALRAARAEILLDEAVDAEVAEIVVEDDEIEFAYDNHNFTRDEVAAKFESNEWTGPYWFALKVDDEVVASIGGVVLDQRGTNDPYARTLIADLALDASDDLRQALGDARDAKLPCSLI